MVSGEPDRKRQRGDRSSQASAGLLQLKVLEKQLEVQNKMSENLDIQRRVLEKTEKIIDEIKSTDLLKHIGDYVTSISPSSYDSLR